MNGSNVWNYWNRSKFLIDWNDWNSFEFLIGENAF